MPVARHTNRLRLKEGEDDGREGEEVKKIEM